MEGTLTLKEALKTFILQVPDSGPVFMGEVVDNDAGQAIVLRDSGSWQNDASGYWRYPAIDISVRSKDQDQADAVSIALYEALNTGRRIELAPGYTVARSVIPSPPESDGRDAGNRWIRRFDCNFLTHAAAAI